MIPLHPTPDAEHLCPYCDVEMQVEGWYIPGMRNLVRTLCPICGRAYYGDLPAGQGLYSPMLLEVDSGVVHDRVGVPWFAAWLRDSFASRNMARLDYRVEQRRQIERAVLLNCLDTLYGHCLLKLLNAEHYLDNSPDLGLIALVPRFLRWLVPEGVAAIWTVDLPLDQGTQWNDWLAGEVRRRIHY
jgi:hypothetical protein